MVLVGREFYCAVDGSVGNADRSGWEDDDILLLEQG